MVQACVAEIGKKRARCRNNRLNGSDFCSGHPAETSVRVSAPDKVLLKFNLNKTRADAMHLLGVPFKQPNRPEQERRHIQQANQLGRRAYRYRKIADSGVPVFGKDGASNLALIQVWEELSLCGYFLLDIHILPPRRNKRMSVLVLSMSRDPEDGKFPSLSRQVEDALLRLLESSWEHVHVWANGENECSQIMHTVNCVHRLDGSPTQHLRFAEGRWAIE